jgi:hypothetical protein
MNTLTEQKTDNELIAEFMDTPVYQTYADVQAVPIDDLKPYFLADQIKYDTSWDWLMPVVEKIQEPEISADAKRILREPAEVTIFYKNCQIEYSDDDNEYSPPNGVKGETKIEAVYKAVVDFIKWYNSQKQTP